MTRLGWTVQITRSNGTTFLCASTEGVLPPVWLQRSHAVAHKRELRIEGFNAKVVQVRFADIEVVS